MEKRTRGSGEKEFKMEKVDLKEKTESGGLVFGKMVKGFNEFNDISVKYFFLFTTVNDASKYLINIIRHTSTGYKMDKGSMENLNSLAVKKQLSLYLVGSAESYESYKRIQ